MKIKFLLLFLSVAFVGIIVIAIKQQRNLLAYQSQLESAQLDRDFLRFQFMVSDLWSVQQYDIVKGERDPNKFYFVANFSGTSSGIFVYDSAKDIKFKNGGIVNTDSFVRFYEEKMEMENELRLAGIINNQVVFYKTGRDDSPGPCFSEWLGTYPLYFIDVNAKGMEKKLYVVPEEKKKREQEKVEECSKKL